MCLSISGTECIWFEKGALELKNYFKQIPVLIKFYTDFECNLSSVESYEGSYSKKFQDHFPRSFVYKLVCVNDKFSELNVV